MHHKMVHYPRAYDCPYCSSISCVRRGKLKGIQAYTCKTCGKSFRDTTNTSLHRLHKKDKVGRYLQAMRLGLSIRKAAAYAGISKNTSFAWRHKFLSSASLMSRPKETNTVVGVSLISVPYSEKGRKKSCESDKVAVKSLLLVSESGMWLDCLTKHCSRLEIATHLTESLNGGFIVQKTDRILTRTLKRLHEPQKLTNSLHKKWYNEQSCRKETELFAWMKRFKGVASKYLQNYWAWYLLLYRCIKLKTFVADFEKLCMSFRCIDTYFHLKNI